MVSRTIAVDGSVHFAPVVMDFGLARDSEGASGLTESGAVMGTPAYMSPEQARGEARRLERRSDVYSLDSSWKISDGKTYEIVVGERFRNEAIAGSSR